MNLKVDDKNRSAKIFGTVEAARRLGISRSRILDFIADGRLPAVKIGRTWAIRPADLARVKPRKPGWPKGRSRKGVENERRQGL